MPNPVFKHRTDAAQQLVEAIHGRELTEPLVLGIPRGGMVIASVLAAGIDAECDVMLARKLRAPDAPQLAIGAVSEDGAVYFNRSDHEAPEISDEYVHAECQTELKEIARRKELFRGVRPAAPTAGRSVIVADDGVATGATMIAALQSLSMQHPAEVIVAVPVAPPDRLREVRNWCEKIFCLRTPEFFHSVGQFYEEFDQVTDQEVAEHLRRAASRWDASRR